MTPEEFSKMPYIRVMVYDVDTDTYMGKIAEFPGCIVQGDTPNDTNDKLNCVAADWINATEALGQSVPKPIEEQS